MDPILVKHELNMLCNLLSVWTYFEADTLKHFEKKSRKLSRGRGLIVMKIKPHVSCNHGFESNFIS